MSHGLLPVNLTTGGLRTSVARAGLSGAAAGEPDATAQEAIQVPEASDLSMWEQENYQLTASAAGSLGFPLWSASTDDHVKIILFGISRYCDLSSGEHTFRYGVAIRVLLEILDVKGDAKLGLPAIAAQVELGDLQASSLLLVSGYAGNISATLPAWQNFDVKSYSDYFTAVTSLQKTIFDDPDNMRPVLLGSTLAQDLVAPGQVNGAQDAGEQPETQAPVQRWAFFHHLRWPHRGNGSA